MVCQTQACLRPVDVHVCSMFTPGYVSMPLKRILSQAQLRDTHMHTASKLRRAPEALNSLFATLTSNKSKMTVELECVDLAQDIFYLICRTYAIFPSQTRKKVQKDWVQQTLFPYFNWTIPHDARQDWAKQQGGVARSLCVHCYGLFNRAGGARIAAEGGVQTSNLNLDKNQKKKEAQSITEIWSWI